MFVSIEFYVKINQQGLLKILCIFLLKALKSMKKINLSKKNNRWWLIDKAFISLFITGMSIELSHVGAGFVDGMMVGSFLGPDALAAEGIAHPIYSIIGILSGMLFVGMQVCCAQELGRGRLKKVSEVFSITVYAGTILSVIMTILTVMFSGKLAILLGAAGKAA